MADQQPKELPFRLEQPSDAEGTQQTRFTESISIDFVYDEDTLQYAESIERSCKQLDNNFVFRFYILMCLRNVPPFASNKDKLIKLFETENVAAPEVIKNFRET
ncbi:unnamed protein product, partial [Rotaria sp. Silwood1]